MLFAGSIVFRKSEGPVDLRNHFNWWMWMRGADWRHPEGPGSSLHGRERHPVVHIGFSDAEAYAAWAGKELPTEAEWEYAARGGLDEAEFAWGNEFMEGVQEVKQLDDTLLHWAVDVSGRKTEWDAKIINQEPDRRIAWESVDGRRNRGAVTFVPLGPERTRVQLNMRARTRRRPLRSR